MRHAFPVSWAQMRVSTAKLRFARWQLNGVVAGADTGVGAGVEGLPCGLQLTGWKAPPLPVYA